MAPCTQISLFMPILHILKHNLRGYVMFRDQLPLC